MQHEISYDLDSYTYNSLRFRSFINFSDAHSQVSFVEFLAKSKNLANPIDEFFFEQSGFYENLPSKELLKILHPYIWLSIWLISVKPSSMNSTVNSNFVFSNVSLYSPIAKKTDLFASASTPTVVPSFISRHFVRFVNFYFSQYEKFFNSVTFYGGYKFKTCRDTVELASELRKISSILCDRKYLSFYFYLNVIRFCVRSLRYLNITFRNQNFNVSLLFTYTCLIIQFEEIYTIFMFKLQDLKPNTNRYKRIKFFAALLKKKLNALLVF